MLWLLFLHATRRGAGAGPPHHSVCFPTGIPPGSTLRVHRKHQRRIPKIRTPSRQDAPPSLPPDSPGFPLPSRKCHTNHPYYKLFSGHALVMGMGPAITSSACHGFPTSSLGWVLLWMGVSFFAVLCCVLCCAVSPFHIQYSLNSSE